MNLLLNLIDIIVIVLGICLLFHRKEMIRFIGFLYVIFGCIFAGYLM